MTRSSSLDIWSQSCPFALAGFGDAPSSQAPQCLLAPSPLLSSRNSLARTLSSWLRASSSCVSPACDTGN